MLMPRLQKKEKKTFKQIEYLEESLIRIALKCLSNTKKPLASSKTNQLHKYSQYCQCCCYVCMSCWLSVYCSRYHPPHLTGRMHLQPLSNLGDCYKSCRDEGRGAVGRIGEQRVLADASERRGVFFAPPVGGWMVYCVLLCYVCYHQTRKQSINSLNSLSFCSLNTRVYIHVLLPLPQDSTRGWGGRNSCLRQILTFVGNMKNADINYHKTFTDPATVLRVYKVYLKE